VEWDRLLSAVRLDREGDRAILRPGRTEFDSDVGRILFSGSFRRLARKTQVHPLAPNDHVHTRLTHSLEVAHVGRALGKELGRRIKKDLPQNITPDDLGTIVHAACLAHDLGNPPFGHGGEVAMENWFELKGKKIFKDLDARHGRDLTAVEGNAQGFRLVAQTENHLFNGGLQLTYATLGAFHKYPWTSRRRDSRKFGSYLSEETILDRVAEKLGLVQTGRHCWCRHPLAHLVEAADDICYSIIDLEDAVELKILPFEKVANFFLDAFDAKEQATIRNGFAPGNSHRINLARLRSFVFDKTISKAMEVYLDAYPTIMEGRYDGNIFELLPYSDPVYKIVFGAKRIGGTEVYKWHANCNEASLWVFALKRCVKAIVQPKLFCKPYFVLQLSSLLQILAIVLSAAFVEAIAQVQLIGRNIERDLIQHERSSLAIQMKETKGHRH
jgi:dGTPase